VFRKQKNIRVLMDEVTAIDRSTRTVRLASGDDLPFDYLVVAVGNQPSYFGHDEWANHATGLKTLQDALSIRERILLSFEESYRQPNAEARKPYLTFVCVGGGPTGVEMAGAIAEIGKKTMTRDFPGLNASEIIVYLLEGSDRVLNTYHPSLSDRARRDLEGMGVTVRTKTLVTDVQPDSVVANGEHIRTVNVIWAAGNAANPLLASLKAETDRAGRIVVGPDCALPDDETVFVIGDAANIRSKNGQPLPGVAQTAIQSGQYVGDVIRAGSRRPFRPAFKYWDKGNMATIGRAKAIAETGRFRTGGFLAWAMWLFIHIVYLVGFRNRISVLLQWCWYYLTFQPGSRILFWKNERQHSPSPTTQRIEVREPVVAE
jgi:NADH dehydrogenase